MIEKVIEGKVFTLTVSTGDEERVFFFTRGAILFLAVGTSGGEVLARKIVNRGLLARERVDALVARANADTPLLQDILREESILDPKLISSLVEETIEDHLLEVMLWENTVALYDLVPGNPPPRLYEQDVPALRLSVGAKPLLARILAAREEAPEVLGALGALRNRVSLREGAAVEAPVGRHLSDTPRPISEVLVAAQLAGEPAWKAATSLVGLVRAKQVQLERVPERTRQEELAQAMRIEDAFQGFLNALLARTHLASIYERANEKEKAAEQYRGIAHEHLKRDAVDPGLAALKNVTRLLPQDVGARELIVKVLQSANRLNEAAREAVDLARVFLDQNFPGRARQAYELALKLVPKNGPVLWMLAGLLSLLGEKESAIRRFQELAEMARQAGDKEAEVAAYQQILDLDPSHGEALDVVRRLSGYKDALRRRIAAVSASFVVFLAVITYGIYELAALSAYRDAREKARTALEEPSFDVARSAIEEFRRGWTLTRLRWSAASILAAIDEEEKVFRAQRSLAAERQARELEGKNQVPKALERWRAAFADAQDLARKSALEPLVAQCESKLKKVTEDLERARELEKEGFSKQAYDLIAGDIPLAPWLAQDPDLRVPLLLDSIPKDARITLAGQLQEKPTPLLVHRPLGPFKVRLDGRNREPLEWEIAGAQPWPLVLVLPRKAAWRQHDLAASSAPLVLREVVVLGGIDRSLVAVARDTGEVRWRTSLGVFGECDAAPVLLDVGMIAARARSGSLHGVTTSGAVRFTRDFEPPPFDPVEPHPERPVPTPRGVLVRSGARGLALVGADGKSVWETRAEVDLVGAPAAQGDLVLVAGERRVIALKLADGSGAWVRDLPASAVLGPAASPRGAVFVPLEQGALALLDAKAQKVSVLKDLLDAGVSTIESDPRWTLVGSQSGDLLALDDQGKVIFRAATDQQRPVLWVRPSSHAVLFGDAATLYAIDREGKELWRTPVTDGAPAAADDRFVFQGTPAGLTAYDR
ncbi:MAG: PQQ-binding-like beta-propeller repeat protein, partial [Planctomycetota bacterium]